MCTFWVIVFETEACVLTPKRRWGLKNFYTFFCVCIHEECFFFQNCMRGFIRTRRKSKQYPCHWTIALMIFTRDLSKKYILSKSSVWLHALTVISSNISFCLGMILYSRQTENSLIVSSIQLKRCRQIFELKILLKNWKVLGKNPRTHRKSFWIQ